MFQEPGNVGQRIQLLLPQLLWTEHYSWLHLYCRESFTNFNYPLHLPEKGKKYSDGIARRGKKRGERNR